MTTALPPSSFSIRRPSGGLSRFISQYWLSLNSSASLYTALPDGCVDLVFEVTANDCRSWVYGTTTRRTDIACTPGSHYLGIRFQPGQSRHFIHAAAHEITDCHADLHALMQFPAEFIATRLAATTLFDELDVILSAVLCQSPPVVSYIDHVIQHVETHHGLMRVDDVASHFCKSRRQMERAFLHSVGVLLS